MVLSRHQRKRLDLLKDVDTGEVAEELREEGLDLPVEEVAMFLLHTVICAATLSIVPEKS